MSAPNTTVAESYDEKHLVDNQHLSESETIDERLAGDTALANAPWQYKLIALITALCFPIGSHFSASALAAMKAQLKTHLDINNAGYGAISSAVSIVNTIFPIMGGIFVDAYGSIWGTLTVNSIVIIGSLLTAIAAKYQSYGLMLASRFIFGIGSGLIVTMQEAILSKWFRTQNLAIAIGLQLSISRLATFLGTLVANPIAKTTNDWVWPFWLSLIMCCFSILMNIAYALVVRSLRKDNKGVMSTEEIQKLKQKKKFEWRAVLKFPWIFWQILLIEFLYAAVWSSFQTISTEFVQVHFKSNAVLAGYKASASQTVPIVATPILGIVMDMYGCRVDILLLSSVFLILSTILLGWTYVNAVVGMVFYSISLAFGPIAMITSIGMILPSDYIGTGLGMYKSSNNIGTTILDIVIGVVQDKTQGHSYVGVMVVFLVLACIGFFLIIGLWITQYTFFGNLLEARRQKRMAMMKERNDAEIDLKKKGLSSYHNTSTKLHGFFCLGTFVSALLVAWVIFIYYSVKGKGSA
ncbi:major facilitator superfamily domain-containing protein [Sporodiniella umbellata]|nr:major facilitator superfamily domain-containing protein [Sporodiniella umbellata]